MATNKPRIQVTLSQELYDVITAYAALQGVSRSRAVGEMLEPSKPALERLVELLTAAKMGEVSVKDQLLDSLGSFVGEVEDFFHSETEPFLSRKNSH